MKLRLIKAVIFLLVLASITACQPVIPFSNADDGITYRGQFMAGDTYILKAKERIIGDISGVGSTLIIENGAQVSGNISLMGSHLVIAGTIEGDINVMAGTSIIEDTAVIRGDINKLFHQANISPTARITGDVKTIIFPPALDEGLDRVLSRIISWLHPANLLIILTGRLVVFVLIALLVITLFPEPTERLVAKIRGNVAPAWGVGMICMVATPLLALVFIITICLSPIGIVLLLLLLIGYIWGWVGLSFLFGQRLMTWLGWHQSREVITVIGATSITFLSMLLSLIPIVGSLLNLMVSAIGLGGVIFSRFGTIAK